MIQDTVNPIMVRLILTTGILLLFSWGVNADPQEMKRLGQTHSAEVASHMVGLAGDQGMMEADTQLMNEHSFDGVLADGR